MVLVLFESYDGNDFNLVLLRTEPPLFLFNFSGTTGSLELFWRCIIIAISCIVLTVVPEAYVKEV